MVLAELRHAHNADERLKQIAQEHGKDVSIHLFGQEVNPETYAITKADLLIKGEGDEAEYFFLGSTLSQDAFPSREFDFMLSNPPYGKSWKTDMERMGGKAASSIRVLSLNTLKIQTSSSSPGQVTAR